MPKREDLLKYTTVKNYISDKEKIRSKKSAIKNLTNQFNKVLKEVISHAAGLAREDKRTTIMDADIETAIKKYLAKEDLNWEEITEQIIKENPTDLSKIKKAILSHIRSE